MKRGFPIEPPKNQELPSPLKLRKIIIKSQFFDDFNPLKSLGGLLNQ